MRRIWVEREKCLGCKSCELHCAIERDSISQTLKEAIKESPKPNARVRVAGRTGQSFPLQCRHCQDAPCLRACPSGAIKRDEQADLVLLDQMKCRGCWMCVMACPYGVVVPAITAKVAIKCDTCLHRGEPACVKACPTGALFLVDDDDAADRRF